MKTHHLLLLLCFSLLMACGGNDERPNGGIKIEVEPIRLDKELMGMKNKAELQQFLNENPWYSKSLYRTFPEDTAFVNRLYTIISNTYFKDFYQEVDRSFGNLNGLKAEFSAAFSQIKQHYPAFQAPKVYTTLTGLEHDLFVSDSTVIVSLEAFLGPEARYRPDQPSYILQRYNKSYIVPSVVRLLSQNFIESDQKDTMLSEMIAFGKMFEFTQEMMPNTPQSLIIAMSDNTLANNWHAQDLIWAHFIDKGLLYEQSRAIKAKYLGERPKVTEIGPSCPGRIGQWLGWRIVQKFRTENPEVSFEELMKMKDAQKILSMSKYRGLVED
ncbi:gliding motility protein [Marinilongibacter aquaticus]|uniref:gliding motility protein GldB-related protein n=1 Tax=Marinilongibacter aquaticus TaxID=2975157 RepID=UPI0021BD0399|nr:gliding motility protein [Marinilongibacter aquaticus]UBM57380.1 gliding motility protein [Marinilongibacter aquaticus]